MSAAAISHLGEVRTRSRPARVFPETYLLLWPVLLAIADFAGLAGASVLVRQTCLSADALFSDAVVLALFLASGLYRSCAADCATELRNVFRSICLAGVLVALKAAFCDGLGMARSGRWAMSAVIVLSVSRWLLRSFLVRSGHGLAPAVIVGSGSDAYQVHELLTKHKHLGIRPVAMIDDIDGDTEPRVVFLANTTWNSLGLRSTALVDNVLERSQYLIKRLFDLAIAPLAAVPSSFLSLPICLGVRFSSKGTVLFRQSRVGKGGKYFEVLKFRSMVLDAEQALESHLATEPEARREWAMAQKLRNDPRVFPVGAWLRKTSVDELPQLWNVMRGEMSLVGPRPVTPEEVVRYGDAREAYMSVRPGLTGLWQVSGRSRLSYGERVSLDKFYVRHRSVWLDMHVLFRTIPTLLSGGGAY